ncbi:Uncharacterized protein SCF082_LOCUS41306 [Durusdinium trenchii]|uniref:Uncharacterized protein n=1 Tax=Durusdinium trenchii TaxID=1381693 RepID=A0ABP0QGL2_9DINO
MGRAASGNPLAGAIGAASELGADALEGLPKGLQLAGHCQESGLRGSGREALPELPCQFLEEKTFAEPVSDVFWWFLTEIEQSILFSTAQWPVFDLLHRLARRPRLDDDLSLEDEDARQGAESEESTWPAGSVEAGQQRLSPALVLEYYRLFHVVTSLFSLFRLHWWVSHGTLIGALRDGGLSRHADDCEVDLPEKEVEILQSPAMLARLSRNGYELSYDPRGRCFKVWPGGSARADAREAQLVDQSWWLPQQRVGTPSLDIYLVQTPEDGRAERMYISNDVFHCNELSCQQYWNRWELQSFYEVPFGLTVARVPSGAASYLERVYGWDWNITVRPHGWASQHGEGFEAKEVASLHKRAAEPFGPLPHVL